MNAELNGLLNTVVCMAQAQSGQFDPRQPGMTWVVAEQLQNAPRRARVWSEEDEQRLRKSIGIKTDEQIAADLGRTPAAIKIRRQRRGMPAHSKRPGWLTGNRTARLLGVDVHSIMLLCARGLLPHEMWYGGRNGHVLMIREVSLFRWAVNPLNWIYFRTNQVKNRRLWRLIDRQKERWQDAWWTPGQVAEFHGVEHTDVNRFINAGKLPARRWGNWWILRSDATRPGLHFNKGKGHARGIEWSAGCDAFWVLGRAVGISTNALDQMTWPAGEKRSRRASFRLNCLMDEPEKVEEIIRKHELSGVLYDAKRRMLFADWREHAERFPALEMAILLFWANLPMSAQQIYMVRGVLVAWMDWHRVDGPRMISPKWGHDTQIKKLWEMVDALERRGIKIWDWIPGRNSISARN